MSVIAFRGDDIKTSHRQRRVTAKIAIPVKITRHAAVRGTCSAIQCLHNFRLKSKIYFAGNSVFLFNGVSGVRAIL